MKAIKIIFSIIIIGHTVSCSDFLDIDVSKDQIDKNKVFDDNKTATSATMYLYTLLRANGFLSGTQDGIGYLMACYTDELDVTVSQETPYRHFYDLTVFPNNQGVSNLWDASYQQIFASNVVLEGLKSSSGISEELKKQLIGEALTIRAIVHLYLTETFDAVPYVSSTDYSLNKQIKKTPKSAVMQKILEDLLEAELILSEQYPSAERIRINKSVVQAFLARVYLYMEDWEKAKQYAEMLIDNPNYQLEPLDKLFLKDSKSAIWQFQSVTDAANTLEGMRYIFTSLPPPFAKVSNALFNDFESNDLREDLWIKWVETGESKAAHPYKYKERGGTTPSKEYSIILRIEEQYLIAAEAAAELQDWETYNRLLNKLRTRSGLSLLEVNTIEQAIKIILQERRIEFFCEFGHRFYDLKRRKQLMTLTTTKPMWKTHFQLLPIPEKELFLNPNLMPQNPSY